MEAHGDTSFQTATSWLFATLSYNQRRNNRYFSHRRHFQAYDDNGEYYVTEFWLLVHTWVVIGDNTFLLKRVHFL
jgi:hypothetical protein